MRRPIVNLDDARLRARRHLPRMVFDFVDGGAQDEITLHRNLAAYKEYAFVPRELRRVTTRSLGVTVLGQPLDLPVLLAPTGMVRLVHRGAESAAAAAAAAAGTAIVVSVMSSDPIEEVAAAAPGRSWFQIFTCRDRRVTEALIDRAARAGAAALCVTIDTPAPGRRERDLRTGMTLPPRLRPATVVDIARHPAWLMDLARRPEIPYGNFRGLLAEVPATTVATGKFALDQLVHPAKDWDEIAWVRSIWNGPLVIKGVMTADSAQRAVDVGADGVIVSNHGGRQLDGMPASLEALPEVVAAVAGRADVLLDGGIRRGSHVAIALALGAKACLIGRPFLYGLAIGGEAGVSAVLDQLRSELDHTLTLLHCRSVTELDADVVRRY